MIVRCPEREYAQVKFLVCLYLCPKNIKVKCPTYEKNYEALVAQDVEDKYFIKYGAPEYPLPRARVIAQKKAEKAAKVAEKKAIEDAKPKKRKRRTKKEVEAAKVKETKKKKDKQAIPADEAKPKRKRRTKKEMEEARAKEAKAKPKRKKDK